MDSLKIKILNPKALELIRSMQDLKLIEIKNDPSLKARNYLEKMRDNDSAPDLDEITKMVEDVRAERYSKK